MMEEDDDATMDRPETRMAMAGNGGRSSKSTTRNKRR